MTQPGPSTFVSSVPGTYEAMVELVRAACEAQEQPTFFADFELALYEPSQYVIVTGFSGPLWEWEGVGTFEQKEHFAINGYCTIFTGDSPATNPLTAIETFTATWNLFQATVMTPVISNRNQPILGTTGPSAYLVLPDIIKYDAGVGEVDGAPAGWESRLDWSFKFSSVLSPTVPE